MMPVGAPSSRPRPKVLLASNRRPPSWPPGRGRASAAVASRAIPKVASRALRAVISRDPSARIAVDPDFVHNNDVVRLHTAVCVLTSAAACGSGPSAPRTAPQEPPPPRPVQVVVVDAAVADAPEPPTLSCDPGTQVANARAPEPTLYCARPDGTRHGPFVTVFPDGTPQITGSYKDGALDGAWQRRSPSGAVVETGEYAAGLPSGHWQMMSEAGALLGEYDMTAG